MSRECEVCGRPIRTGRKYCYEHRNSNQNYGLNSMDKLERNYIYYRTHNKRISNIFLLIGIVFSLIMFFIFKEKEEVMFIILGTIIFPLVMIILLVWLY